MKKMLITAISAIAVIAAIVGCQVYDSQTNKVLASGMNTSAEGKDVVQWIQLEKDFNKACNDYYDNTSDGNLKKVAEMYLSFDKFYLAALDNVKSYNNRTDVSDDTKADPYDVEKVKDCYIKQYMAWGKSYDMYAYIKAYKKQYKKQLNTDMAADLKSINDKTASKDLIEGENKDKIEEAKQIVKDKYTVSEDEYPYVDMDVSTDVKTGWSISGLYQEVNKLRWDYNSKK